MKVQEQVERERFVVSLDASAGRSTLTVTDRILNNADAAEFEAACTKLLHTGQRELVVDMRPLQSVPSIVIGEVAKTRVIAGEAGHRFRLVTNEKIAGIFRMILQDLIEIEVRT
jgi:anti-anti-sigma regulatory factor